MGEVCLFVNLFPKYLLHREPGPVGEDRCPGSVAGWDVGFGHVKLWITNVVLTERADALGLWWAAERSLGVH